jgi:hypothetical protein
MKIVELVGSNPYQGQLDHLKKQEKAIKVGKSRVKAQQAQAQLRAAQASAKP